MFRGFRISKFSIADPCTWSFKNLANKPLRSLFIFVQEKGIQRNSTKTENTGIMKFIGEASQFVVLASLLQEALKHISETVERARKSKGTRRALWSTLKNLNPLVQEIKLYNDDLDRPREEIRTLMKEKDAGEKELSCTCSSCHTCWSWIKQLLWEKRNSFPVAYDDDDEKEALMGDVEETLYEVRKILELLSKENLEHRFIGAPIKRSCGVPPKSEFLVGLDVPLRKLKMEVLRDGVSIIVLTGLGGSGKTTLATRLCWDEQVKSKFKENILFLSFSVKPNLKIIVEKLFEHCGYRVPAFQSDEDAVNRMGLLLKQIGESPILLILDDVWPGSEALVEKFKVRIPDFKILVTSRVAFPRFGTSCILKPLCHEDALTLFRHFAYSEEDSSKISDHLVQKVVRSCMGSPLAIEVIGKSLRHQPHEFWLKMVEKLSQGHSILDSNTELLNSIGKILNILEDQTNIKECFMDLGLFPEDQRIPVTALIDMWAELYGLDDDGIEAMVILNTLHSMHLANVLVVRKNIGDADNYNYNNHFVVLHDLLRELANHQSSQEPIEQRQRLIIDTREKTSDRWLAQKQQFTIRYILSNFLRCCVRRNPPQVPARTLSISIDENCASSWSNMQLQTPEAEVLMLNLRTNQYTFPEFIEKMTKLKVLIVTNYRFHPSELNNFKLLASLSNLKRIRLERISVPSFVPLKNLKKLSLYMSNTCQAFENSLIKISIAFPNLVDVNIDYCKDIVRLPSGVCDITSLKKLSVTNCHNLIELPQEIGNLENLELLRLNSCTDLKGLPDSIGRLSNLRLLDISNCISLPTLPEDVGNLSKLRNLYMSSCGSCELPFSVANLENLKVTCDEETAASWETFESVIHNLRIVVPQVDVNLNWLH